jgi:hypothetical protein
MTAQALLSDLPLCPQEMWSSGIPQSARNCGHEQ